MMNSNNARAWRADSIGDSQGWYYALPGTCLAALREVARAGHGRPITELRLGADLRSACAAELGRVLDALEQGPGFAIVRGPAPDRSSPEEAQALYWLAGQALGEPVSQNVEGVLLYDVRDTGQQLSQGARFSVTSYESSFHTDNSFGDAVVDYVGLLCLCPARAGGLSQVVSGYAVCDCLRREAPDVLAALSAPYHFDRRGGVRAGETPTALFPVLGQTERGLLFRYLRYWIEVGHEKGGVPLAPEQVRALDVLDGVLARPGLRAEFALRPGDMFFVNNRWILHNRTAFEDDPEPGRRRHLVRLWLRARR
ncbi:MAG TPA: TauD/TfdA family dioxygenase [Gemmataceae bacterium]|nr:TauD/TfdA family dioxygenase [Gemmataceae bacterium]